MRGCSLFSLTAFDHTLLDADHEPGPLLIDLLYELTATKDGAVTISAGTDEMQMRSLIAVGMEHLLADERFNSFEKLVANLEVFKELVAEAYLQFTQMKSSKSSRPPTYPVRGVSTATRCWRKNNLRRTIR